MCVSLHPAHFSGTIVGTFDRAGQRYLAYSNVAQSGSKIDLSPRRTMRGDGGGFRGGFHLTAPRRRSGSSDWDLSSSSTPSESSDAGFANALILPIPDDFRNISVIDTTKFGAFPADIQRALTPQTRGGLRRGPVSDSMLGKSVRIIEFDIYTIILSPSAEAIAQVLASSSVPANRRPDLNKAVLDKYTPWYKGWALAVCLFDTRVAKRGKPLLFKYKPTMQKDPDKMFIPTLDDHSGKGPDLNAEVDVDHTIFAAVEGMPGGAAVRYTDAPGQHAMQSLLPTAVYGENLTGTMKNGDIIVDAKELRAGRFSFHRVPPPDSGSKPAVKKEPAAKKKPTSKKPAPAKNKPAPAKKTRTRRSSLRAESAE